MKRFFSISIIMLLIFLSIVSFAEEHEVNIYVNNDKVSFDQQPLYQNNRVKIPFRKIFEHLGYEVSYDEKNKVAIAQSGDYIIKVPISSNRAIKDGKVYTLQEKTKVLNNRIMVDQDFFKNLMGFEVKKVLTSDKIEIHIYRKIDLSKYFKGYKGTFKLYNMKNQDSIVYNEKDLKRRTSPASTYKIINSLIALETGVIDDENTVKKWDGKKRYVPSWNKDHTLASAIKNSVIWYYQDLARDIGRERMQKYIDKLQYGNQKIGDKIDMFWLDGSLKISPEEQLKIIKNLYNEELPFDKEVIKTVKKILVNEETEKSILSGKTGTYMDNGDPKASWYVGYIVSDDIPYGFVTRLEKPDVGKSGKLGGWKAKEITKEILKEMNILK